MNLCFLHYLIWVAHSLCSLSLYCIPNIILSKHKTASPLWFYFRPLERRKLRIHFYDSRVTDDHYHMFTWEIWRLWILNRILDAKWTLECARAKFLHSRIPYNLTNLLVTNYTQSNTLRLLFRPDKRPKMQFLIEKKWQKSL